MLAVRLHPGGRLELVSEPEPQPAEGEVVIKVGAVGLCGSDRHWLLDGGIGDARLDEPLVPGHEFAGQALSGRYAGQLVAADPTISCQRCPACRAGLAHLCTRQRFSGYSGTDGALRERMSWPERLLFPLPPGVDAAQGALVEPLAIALHAVELGGPLEARSVGVVGCGPIGLLIVSLARENGAKLVLAAEPLAHRLAEAERRGARALPGHVAARRELVEEVTSGMGLDVVFEVAGEDEAVDASIELVRPAGKVVLVGIPAVDRTSFTASAARRKGLTLVLTRRSTEATFRRAVELCQQGSLELRRLLTSRVPLSRAQVAFDKLVQREGIKVVIEPGGVA